MRASSVFASKEEVKGTALTPASNSAKFIAAPIWGILAASLGISLESVAWKRARLRASASVFADKISCLALRDFETVLSREAIVSGV